MKRHVKSGVLALLVVVSVGLSYVLWHGNWQNSTEVAYTDGTTLPAAQSPKSSDVSQPYEVVFTSVKPNHNSVALPQSALYETWMQRLSSAHISGLRAMQVLPKLSTTASANYAFGAEVVYRELARLLPGLPATNLVKSIDNLALYETPDKKSVQLALQSTDAAYVADTDISPAQFLKDVGLVTAQHPWVQWNPNSSSLLPEDGLSMPQLRFKTSQPQILPLVHSFFVNPQALSRIQEDKHTVLFTDGSRVVWWDQAGETLTFADPNSSQTQSFPSADLSASMEFVRNHGGSPSNVFAFRNDTSSKATTYTFRQYVQGYPVFGTLSEYKTEMEQGTVVQYQRPLRDLTQKIDETDIHTFGAAQLADIIHHLVPNTPVSSLTVQLGYVEQTLSADVVMLKPVYDISQNGTSLWTIDANNGKVEQGVRAE